MKVIGVIMLGIAYLGSDRAGSRCSILTQQQQRISKTRDVTTQQFLCGLCLSHYTRHGHSTKVPELYWNNYQP